MIIILSILMSSLFSCEEEIDNSIFSFENHNNDPEEVEVVWKIPIFLDTSECSVLEPVLYNNKLIFGGSITFGTEGRIAACNTETHEIIWDNNCEISSTQLSTVYYQNIFAGFCSSVLTAFDLENGNVLWTDDLDGGYKLTQFENQIFYTHHTGASQFYSGSLVMADMHLGIWDTVFTIDMEDDYSVYIYPPGVFVNEVNDTILFFQNRQWNFPESDGKIDLYAFNMSADSIVWMDEDIEPEGNSSVQPPLIYDGKVYFRGSRTVFCFDALTGEKIWEKYIGLDMYEDLLNSNSLVIDDKLIVKTGGNYIYAFDPETGSEIWVNDDAGPTSSNMTYFEGRLYYGSAGDGMIHVIDAANGTTVIEFLSPADYDLHMSGAGFYDAVAIDPINHFLYAADGYFLYCIKIDW